MATVGLKNFHVAVLTDEATNTYATPVKLGPAIEANVTPNFESATLYGDDRPIESATSMSGIEVEINVADLSPEHYELLMGVTKNADGVIIDNIEDVAPYVALMFEMPKADGKKKMFIYYKGKFQPTSTEAATKGESVEFQTQTITATFLAREDGNWRAHIDTSDPDVLPATVDAWYTAPYELTTP